MIELLVYVPQDFVFRPSNEFNLDPRFFHSEFCKQVFKYSNGISNYKFPNFNKEDQWEEHHIQGLSTVIDSNSETEVIISELWTMDWKVLILSSTLLMQIYMHCEFKTFLYFRSMHHFGREPFLYVFTSRLSLCEYAYSIALMLLRHYHIHTNTLSLC